MESFNPRIVAFCCDKSGYVAADMAGGRGVGVPEHVELFRMKYARMDWTMIVMVR